MNHYIIEIFQWFIIGLLVWQRFVDSKWHWDIERHIHMLYKNKVTKEK